MAGSAVEALERLQDLQRDLLSVSHLSSRTLHNVDRLRAELELHVDEFRSLLDRKRKNEESRKSLASDTIKLEDGDYAITDAFRQQTQELANALDLDEFECAKLLIQGQDESTRLDRSPLASSVIIFHQSRQYRLECIRLAVEYATNSGEGISEDIRDQTTDILRLFTDLILQPKPGDPPSGSQYWRRCLEAMRDIEGWMHHVAERIQSISMTDQSQSYEFSELMSFQRTSLMKQHESLGAIAYWLVKAGRTHPDDLRALLDKMKGIDRYDAVLIHYLPALFCSISQFASSESFCSAKDAKDLYQNISSTKDTDAWPLRNFRAATLAVWLAEYSGRFHDSNSDRATIAGSEEDEDADARALKFSTSLKDGAFHFLLAVSQDVTESDWYDPARRGFTSFLIQDAPALHSDQFKVEPFTQRAVLDRFQAFADAYITNMPDSLRRLKLEEDEQRRQMQSRVNLRPAEYDLHLERFLLIISYAFEGSLDASDAFWSEPDGNLYGFLRWSSQRQSTPRVAAFSEMLTALSAGEEGANAAHRFLLNEGSSTSAKLRKNSQLSWTHIFGELEFYASTIRDRPAPHAGAGAGSNQIPDQLVEPESAMMLECYLRLVAHLGRASPAARDWLLNHPTFNMPGQLVLLCSSSIESRLRACAFTALAGLLTNKDLVTQSAMWQVIDAWIFGQANTSTIAPSRSQQHPPNQAGYERVIFEQLTQGFEEPNAFSGLLQTLVLPIKQDDNLKDSLPFPEDLGSKYRMSGIEPYVDFVMDSVFAAKSLDLEDKVQLRVMRWNCLSFAAVCLSSFNENLVVLANRSNISVDSAIETSSLSTYARMHPFARVMEWFFNERVISALFSAACQDVVEINEASADSPLILGLLRSIEIIELILSLQSTYFEIVRPLIKTQASSRRQVVSNSALASFEDAILNHLDLITHLGLYCGTGHADLAISSLRLLQRLSSSRKLSIPVAGGSVRPTEKSKLILALERGFEAESISRTLVGIMQFDIREAEAGPESPGAIIKTSLLSFLRSSIGAVLDRPTMAHSLLGFACTSHNLFIEDDSLFAAGQSLFHSVIDFVNTCPDGEGPALIPWLLGLKNDALQVLRSLWKSSLSSPLALMDLRLHDFFFQYTVHHHIVVDSNTIWGERSILDPDFFLADSAAGLASFLQSRSAYLELAATELRYSKDKGATTLQERIRASLFGNTELLSGESFETPTIFDCLDFLELDIGDSIQLPESQFFDIRLFDACKTLQGDGRTTYDISQAEQILHLRENELAKEGRLTAPTNPSFKDDQENYIACLVANNQYAAIAEARMGVLRAWVQLVTLMLDACDYDKPARNAFVLQMLQLVLPRLERSYVEDMTAAEIMARLCKTLLHHYNTDVPTSQSHDNATDGSWSVADESASDRLFRLMHAGLTGIQSPEATVTLRDTGAQICQTYMRKVGMANTASANRALQLVKSFGDKLIEVLCDDAYAGEVGCKLSCLSLLDSFMAASQHDQSRYFLEAFGRLNFVEVITESLRAIPSDLQNANAATVPFILSTYDASLSLLLSVSQTRSGANQVLSAGFFTSIRDSGIFGADPDMGLDIDNPEAMTRYFELLLSTMRVVNAIVLSGGSYNDQTLSLARQFIQEYRYTMSSIFKRNVGIGNAGGDNAQLLAELVDAFTILLTASGFLEEQQQGTVDQHLPRLFT